MLLTFARQEERRVTSMYDKGTEAEAEHSEPTSRPCKEETTANLPFTASLSCGNISPWHGLKGA